MATATARPAARPRRPSAAVAPRLTPQALCHYFAAQLDAELGPHDVHRLLEADEGGFVLLDVRSREGFTEAHLPGAQHIPLAALEQWLGELPKDQEIITYCWNVTCMASVRAAWLLATHGFRARVMVGGIEAWTADGFAVERGA